VVRGLGPVGYPPNIPIYRDDNEGREMAIASFLYPLQSLTGPSVASSLAGSPAGGAIATSSASLSGFSMQIQSETQWCWAAVSTSVAIFYGSVSWTQCKVADVELSPLDCCGADASTKCNQPWYLDTALQVVGHFNRLISSNSPFGDVQTEINARRPLGCRIAWSGGGAHFLALGGWSIAADGTEYVDVYDPYYGFTQTTYPDFDSSYKSPGDAWTHTYFTLATAAAIAGAASPSATSVKSA
jgi:hypothetical protein